MADGNGMTASAGLPGPDGPGAVDGSGIDDGASSLAEENWSSISVLRIQSCLVSCVTDTLPTVQLIQIIFVWVWDIFDESGRRFLGSLVFIPLHVSFGTA